MNKLYLFFTAFFLMANAATHAQTVNFTDSNLPIIIINTNGGDTIPDDPKIGADMKIIYRGAAQRNYMTDQNTPNYLNYEGRIAIETRGHSSQETEKKPYGFETRMPDNITNRNVPLLSMPADNDWILAPNAYDPTYMHNVLAYQWSNAIDLKAMQTIYCEVVVNGDYRGIYVLTQSIKIGKNRVDVAKILPTHNTAPEITGGYITKSDWTDGSPSWQMLAYAGANPNFLHHDPKPFVLTTQQDAYVQSLFYDLEAKANNNNLTTGYPTVIDTKSWIDYMLIIELGSSVDGYQYSTYLNKDRGGRLNAGPVWDFDLGFGTEWGSQGGRGEYNVWQFDNSDNRGAKFWKDLYDNPIYHCAIKTRWQQLRAAGQPLHLSSLQANVDSISTLLTEAAVREEQRWGPSSFAPEVLYIKDWITQRVAWIDANITTGYATCTLPTIPNLVINEIMYQPHATATNSNSDDYEYIELKNAGTTAINLSGMYLRNGAIYQFPANSTLAANGIIVLAANAAQFQTKYGFAPFGQYFRNFSNAGEEILIVDGYGQTIDKVTYGDDLPWANADSTGKSLELKNVTLNNTLASSWFARNTNGGSPGQENNFVAPCGNTFPAIVINEINYNSGGGISPNDWVELHNPTAAAVNLSGWLLKDGGTGLFTFPNASVIPANGYLLICQDTTKFKQVYPTTINYVRARLGFGLSSSGDLLQLQSPTTCEIDVVNYGVATPWAVAANGTGSTLSLINATSDNTLAASWAASSNQGGSPGRSNVFSPPVAMFSATLLIGNAPLNTTFNAATSTDNGTIISYQWIFGDGTTATGINPSKIYTTGGTYTATLKTTDNDGYIDTYQRLIQVGAPPLADFTITPQISIVNNAVAFDAATSVAYGGRTISTYSWNWGDGSVAGTGINATHNYTAAGSYLVTLTITDNGNFTDTKTNMVYVNAAGSTTTLIPTAGAWQYLDNGTNQNATNWKTTLTPAWASGNAELGYGDSDEITTVSYGSDGSNKYITTYFRKGFNIIDKTQYSNLVIRLKRDDGAVVYVNGIEVIRDNMPSGTIDYLTPASLSVNVPDESTFFTYSVPSSVLIDGVNIISAEVHQNNGGSSDISFDLELTATQSPNNLCTTTPPNIIINEINYKSNTTADSGDWVEIFNASPINVNMQNWAFQDATHTFVLPNITMPAGGYLVICEDTTKFKSIYPTVTNYIKSNMEFGLSTAEHIILRTNTGCIADSLTYKNISPWATTPDGGGYTLSLKMPNTTINNGLAGSWEASYALRGTPGATNVEQAVKIATKMLLSGAYNSTTGLMRDNLRAMASFPLVEPYTNLGLACSGEATTAAVLAITGNNAIVDWVIIELRTGNTSGAVIKRRAALLQADGDVVDVDGTSAVKFINTSPGNYYLAVRHRNHLGIMTVGAVNFDNLANNPIDFTNSLINLHGTNPVRIIAGKRTLWAGNANGDARVVYAGANTDVNAVSSAVFTNVLNPSFLANIPLFGYHRADVNMDGKVVYAGAGTDINIISTAVFTNATAANIPVIQQLP